MHAHATRDLSVAIAMTTVLMMIGAGSAFAQDRAANAAARAQRTRDARGVLAKLLTSTAGAEGRFHERQPGSYVFSPARIDLPQVPVVNNEEIGVFAVGPRLRVFGLLDDRGRLQVKNYQLLAPASLTGSTTTPTGPVPESTRVASRTLVEALESALKPGAMSVSTTRTTNDQSEPARKTRESVAVIRKEYRQAVASNAPGPVVDAIVRRWADARALVAEVFPDGEDFKALYGPLDNYDPWRYDVIFRQAKSVVAIGEPGNPPARCSGVLIGRDLVLTAAHCFAGSNPRAPTDLEVWFDHARAAPPGTAPSIQRRKIIELVAPSKQSIPDMMAGVIDEDLLDYAILRFEAPAGMSILPDGASAQCLRERPLDKGDPLYVIGYPRGEPEMVHDSARVYLPHRVLDGELFNRLRLDVHADMIGFENRDELMKEFDASYEKVQESNGITFRFFHHVKDFGQPRMGIIADTFKGNSGGPVYDRERGQCVVGILVAGAEDTGKRLTPSWAAHERVLPIAAILEDAEKHAPGVKSQLKMEP